MIKQHHVTLKTGVMADENSDLITRINYIKVAIDKRLPVRFTQTGIISPV